MIKKLLLSLSLLGVLVVFTSSTLKDNGIAGKTNSPGEQTCVNSCHNSFALNAGPGSITLTAANMPSFQYTPGQTYDMTVTVAQSGVNLFGTGLEALLSSGANGGTIVISDAASTHLKTISVSGHVRSNLTHQLNGGASANSKAFNFKWTAPAAGSGNVTFYYSGVAANGNTNESGDYVYNSNQVVTELCNAPAQPANITGTANPCEASSENYSVAAVSGATSYTWTLPAGSGWSGTSTSNSINVTIGSATGDLTVTANSACGTSQAQTFIITPQAAPAQPVISVIASETDTLTCYTIWPCQWYLNGGTINGATSNTFVPLQNGTYSVVATNSGGCSSTSADYLFSTLGIIEAQQNNLLSVFPTPATDYIAINVAPELVNNDLTIMDVHGKTVLKRKITDLNTRIDLDGISEGVYFAVIANGTNNSVVRFFVTK